MSQDRLKELARTLGSVIFVFSVTAAAGVSEHSILGLESNTVVWNMLGGDFPLTLASLVSLGMIGTVTAMQVRSWSDIKPHYRSILLLTGGIVLLGILDPGYAVGREWIGILAASIAGVGYWGVQTGGCFE